MFSMKAVFKSWRTNTIVLVLLLAVSTLFTVQHYVSYKKIDILEFQKSLIKDVVSLSRDDIEMANIQFRGASTQIQIEIDKLQKLNELDYFGLLLEQSGHHQKKLDELKERAVAFDEAAAAWFDHSEKNLNQRKKALDETEYALKQKIAAMIRFDALYNQEKFFISQFVIYAALLHALMMLLTFAGRFGKISTDIDALSTSGIEGYELKTEEAETISKRMGRKPSTSENPAMLDQPTGLLNHKGVMHAFANRPAPKDNAFTIVCLLEVDGFAAITKQYPKEFALNVLKKIGFMASLYKQPTDIIGRLDGSRFIIVVTRTTKEAAFKEFDQIRESVDEARFKVPRGEAIRMTVSGGFADKRGGKTFEETLKEAEELLAKALASGGNKILKSSVK